MNGAVVKNEPATDSLSSVSHSYLNDANNNTLNLSNSNQPALATSPASEGTQSPAFTTAPIVSNELRQSPSPANSVSNVSTNSASISASGQLAVPHNGHTPPSSSEGSQVHCSIEYLSQLIKDTKQLQALPNVFIHVERLLEDEINRVRKTLFHLNNVEKKPLVLPEPEGCIVQKQEKVYVPVHEHPNFNFVGRILGPRGMTAKQLEQETGCKIMIRGKGSMRNKHMEEQNRGKPNWEHLSDDLHVLIIVEDTENRATVKIDRAVEEVKKLLVPVTEGEDELKKKQLMELAIINGTYKDANARMLEAEQLKLLQPNALTPLGPHGLVAGAQHQLAQHQHHLQLQYHQQAAMLRNSQALQHAHLQQAAGNSHHSAVAAAAAAAAAANSLGAPLLLGRPSPVATSAASGPPTPSNANAAVHHLHAHHLQLLSSGSGQLLGEAASQQHAAAAAAAAAAFLYPQHHHHPYADQLAYSSQLGANTGNAAFIEYPGVAAVAAAQAAAAAAQEAHQAGKIRPTVTGNVREHPYQRPSS